MIAKLTTAASLLLVALTASLVGILDTTRHDEYILAPPYRAPVVVWMDVGATGYLSRADFTVDVNGAMRVKMTADVQATGSTWQPVLVVRTARGVCVDERTLPLHGFGLALWVRDDQTLPVEDCPDWWLGGAP